MNIYENNRADLPTIPCRHNVDLFRKATSEEPMFARVDLYGNDFYNDNVPVKLWSGLVASSGVKGILYEDDTEEDVVSFRALEEGVNHNKLEYHSPIKRTAGFSGHADNFVVTEMLERTPELMKQYEEAINDIKVTVTYRDYGYKPDTYGHYHEIEGTEVTEVAEGAHSLEDGERWLLRNHPGQFMGSNISTSSGDFSCGAVPCGCYETGYYETRANREKYARESAERLGCEVGEFNYDLMDSIVRKQKSQFDRSASELDYIVNNEKETSYEKE